MPKTQKAQKGKNANMQVRGIPRQPPTHDRCSSEHGLREGAGWARFAPWAVARLCRPTIAATAWQRRVIGSSCLPGHPGHLPRSLATTRPQGYTWGPTRSGRPHRNSRPANRPPCNGGHGRSSALGEEALESGLNNPLRVAGGLSVAGAAVGPLLGSFLKPPVQFHLPACRSLRTTGRPRRPPTVAWSTGLHGH